jgi:ADP-heptose:LPS heptosyltransferase
MRFHKGGFEASFVLVISGIGAESHNAGSYVMDILFIKLGALGDVINTLPLAVTLKEQLHARIHWLVESLSYPLVAEHPSIDRVILFDRERWFSSLPEAVAELRQERFDIALDLQRLIKSGLFCTVSHSTRRIGFDRIRCKELTWLFPFERIPASDPSAHMAYQYLEFACYLGAEPREIRWDIPVAGRPPFNLPQDYVVLNIGATASAKRWTPEGFASLARGLRQRHDISCILTGGAEDALMAHRIESLAEDHVINLVGKTSLLALKEVIAGATVVVTCDTGPMHLAVALGKEVIALIGPTNPKRTGPLKGRIVKIDLDCMPCNKRRCEDPICMTGLTAEVVMRELEGIL